MKKTCMKVEVWSDIMCPFCYIGKRNFETALQQFDGKDDVALIWKSYQLDPSLPLEAEAGMDVYDYLSTRKGIGRDQVKTMHVQVTDMAVAAGLQYNLDNTPIVNSFRAHRLLQMANERGLGDKANECLFYANFTEGKDFANASVLKELGEKIGLSSADVQLALTDEAYARKVHADIAEAASLGINGVPFFVFDRKYAVSGAQPPQDFLQVLTKAHQEWRSAQRLSEYQVIDGPVCTPGGNCD